jgi:hypothetical protein
VQRKGCCFGVNERRRGTRVSKWRISLLGITIRHSLTISWSDGLALYTIMDDAYSSCALIDRYRPDLLQYSTLQRNNHRRNFELAFDAAEKIEIAVISPQRQLTFSLSLTSKISVTFVPMRDPSCVTSRNTFTPSRT